MHILITGITGLLGSNMAKLAIKEGHEVSGLVRKGSDTALINNIISEIQIIEGDILDIDLISQAFKSVDWIYHAAAVVSFAPRDYNIMTKINIEGTANVVNACLYAGVKKLCFVSSVAALGKPALAIMKSNALNVIDENQKWENSNEHSHYAKTKFLAECEVWRGMSEGLNAVIINPSIILGEGNAERSSSQLFNYVKSKKPFYTGGKINYVDIQDVCKVSMALLKSDISNERFVLNAGNIGFKAFFDKIAQGFQVKAPSVFINGFWTGIIWRLEKLKAIITGKAPLITKETAQTANLDIRFENSKIRETLQFSFTPLDKSIERICQYYKNN